MGYDRLDSGTAAMRWRLLGLVTVTAERTFGGITIPSELRAGWWWGTDRQGEGEFFRAEITGAS